MKKILLISLIIIMAGWAIYQYIEGSEEEPSVEKNNEVEDVGLSIGQSAPDFKLTSLEGEETQLSKFRGKPVILNFWATWCPPCRAEMPDFQQLYESEDVEILAVNLSESEQSEKTVQDFIEEYDLSFPILMDRGSAVTEIYKVQVFPTSFIIDSEGIIQFSARGAINYEIMQKELSKVE